MKNLLLWGVIIGIIFTSCNKISQNKLGGDTDIPLNQVGNTFTPGAIEIDGEYINFDGYAEILTSEDGIVTANIVADFSQDQRLSWINDLIPSEFKDAYGKFNAVGKVKITSEGVQDYTNLDEDPFTLIKYDDKVGDTYKLKKSDGKTITRTITHKSETDDFPYGFMLIKTITVEQDSRIPGISKIEYCFNHKFGLVHLGIYTEDGSYAGTSVYAASY